MENRKERPILMNGDMVRAILEGRKTQTRRIAKFRPIEKGLNFSWTELKSGFYCTDNPVSGHVLSARRGDGCWEDKTFPLHCPFGKVGDRLWIRETWGIGALEIFPSPGAWIAYKADGIELPIDYEKDCKRIPLTTKPEVGHHSPNKWRPSIHMPRWASRITLEITDVRVERVQRISNDDAKAEGLQSIPWLGNARLEDYRTPFGRMWDSLYKNRYPKTSHHPKKIEKTLPQEIAREMYSWDANPWVWVVQFKVVAK